MLYKIKEKYYILVGNKYIRVEVVPNGKDDIQLIPKMEEFIEKNNSVLATNVDINDSFKKQIIRNSKSMFNNSRYDR